MRISRAALAGAFAALFMAGHAKEIGAQTAPAPAPDPGRAVMEKACTSCHERAQVTAQHRNARQWSETVDQMIGLGATVSDEEYPVLVAYLAKDFGPQAQPANSPAQ
jgi:hypothetical protein